MYADKAYARSFHNQGSVPLCLSLTGKYRPVPGQVFWGGAQFPLSYFSLASLLKIKTKAKTATRVSPSRNLHPLRSMKF